jgi:peptidoglycan/LPS O-acetylase OafA/YrhL
VLRHLSKKHSRDHMNSAPQSQKRQLELDFIRGIAILMVLHFHYSSRNIFIYPIQGLPLINFGWAGVDLFFVLSGFLVGGLLCKEWKKSGHVQVGRFLKRRGFKIWPAYYFYLLVEVIVRKHPLNSFFWPNLLNYQNYVRTSLSQTWSLAIEEHFYILLSAAIWWCSSRRVPVRRFFYGMMIVAFAVATYRTYLALRGREYFLPTHTRIDALLLGVMLATLFHFSRERFLTLQNKTVLLALIAGGSLIVLLFDPQVSGNGFQIVAADLGSAALFLLLYKPGTADHGRLYKMVAAIGVYSYGIYLWHIGMVSPVQAVLRHFPTAKPYLQYPVTLMVAITVGFLMTKLVEFPFLRLRERLIPTIQTYELPEAKSQTQVPATGDGLVHVGLAKTPECGE